MYNDLTLSSAVVSNNHTSKCPGHVLV